jgi:hypothetical protein
LSLRATLPPVAPVAPVIRNFGGVIGRLLERTLW